MVKGKPNTVTVTSLREYPAGTFTPKAFPGPLTLDRRRSATSPTPRRDVTGQTTVTVPVTFGQVQVSPQQTLTATSGSHHR